MPKPLRSETVLERKDIQFRHFGVLNTGSQSKSSMFTSITLNILLAVVALILGAAAKKVTDVRVKDTVTFVEPKPLPKPPPPMKPPPMPKPPPPKIEPPKIEPPKIVRPEIKPVELPKPVPMKPMEKPLPVMTPAPPKVVVAAAAPKVTSVSLAAKAASVPNNDAHPSAVRLGQTNSPIVPSDRPAVANSVNLGVRGVPGMNSANTGNGPRSSAVSLGNGSPNGSVSGTGRAAVSGVKLGVTGGTPGGTGNGNATVPARINLAHNDPPPATAVTATHPPVRTVPQVIFKPKPVYTAEATAQHIEGTVNVRIRVSSSGSVSVVGVTSGLGHGLDESAIRAAQGIRFRPAQDSAGNPTDWEGVVSISFQLAS